MTSEALKARTFQAAVLTISLTRTLPPGNAWWVLGRQLVRSGTSVPAHYRAACRAQSTRDFIAKMKKLEEEADESALWLALLRAAGLPEKLRRASVELEAEFGELTAIAVASLKTSRARLTREADARRRAHRRA